jgi:hypothetical protein
MHEFIKRFANGVFYPEEVDILTAAFDDAWAKLQASRTPFTNASAAREILAKQIIMAAKRGERNTRYLSQDALLTAAIGVKSRRPDVSGIDATGPASVLLQDAVDPALR